MTIPATPSEIPYLGDGVSVAFPITFVFDTSADIKVIITDADGEPTEQTTGFAITGGGGSTGTCTFSTAPAADELVTLLDDPELTQPASYPDNDAFPAAAHEAALDRTERQVKRLHQIMGRSIRVADGDFSSGDDLLLPLSSARAGKVLAFDVDGNPTLSDTTGGADSALRADLASTLAGADGARLIGFRATGTGAVALAVATVLQQAVTPLMFGAVGSGAVDDSAAWRAAIATGKRVHGGGPQYIYRIDSQIPLTTDCDIDLQGATFKPNGNTLAFVRTASVATKTTTVSSGATLGSRSVVVASATSIAIGQWFRIAADNTPTEDAQSYPSTWGKVTGVAGTTISLDRTLPCTYAGTISFNAYDTSLVLGKFWLRNGTLDGSASTYTATSGQGARIGSVEDVLFENLLVKNWDNSDTLTSAIQAYLSIDVRIVNCRMTGTISTLAPFDIQDCRTGMLADCTIEGSAFGGDITRCEFASFIDNHYIGYRKREADDASVTHLSTRGAKSYGCFATHVIGNRFADYESPVKVQGGHRAIVLGNTIINSGLQAYTGQIAINVASIIDGLTLEHVVIGDNIVENGGGVAIGVDSDRTLGKCIIHHNQVKRCQGVGIYANVRNVIIQGNRVEDWGLRNSADVGIHYSSGATVTGNRFYHSTLADPVTGLACLRSFLQATFRYCIKDNAVESTNRLGIILEAFGAIQINSGTTSNSAAHTLAKTPDSAEITYTPTNNPTTDPGNTWVSAIDGTNFTLNCRTNPGASNATFRWKAAITQPFTA